MEHPGQRGPADHRAPAPSPGTDHHHVIPAMPIGGSGLSAGALIIGWVGGSAIAAERPDLATNPGGNATDSDHRYPVNDTGQTYGSLVDAPLGEEPDLISVQLEDGQIGYIRWDELDRLENPSVNSPEEAAALGETNRPTPLDVYASDGVTVIGQWNGFGGIGYTDVESIPTDN